MTITKEKKNQLLAKYKEDLSNATNAVIVKQTLNYGHKDNKRI